MAASPNLHASLSGCKGTGQHDKPGFDPSGVFHLLLNASVPVPHERSPGDTPVAQPHLGAAEQLCKLGRPGRTSPAPPDRPSRLHLEAIQKSLSPCLTTSLGNAASTTRPSAAAQPLIPTVSAAVSFTYSHAGEATGKLVGSSMCHSMAAPRLPGALAPSGTCGGKMLLAQISAGDG